MRSQNRILLLILYLYCTSKCNGRIVCFGYVMLYKGGGHWSSTYRANDIVLRSCGRSVLCILSLVCLPSNHQFYLSFYLFPSWWKLPYIRMQDFQRFIVIPVQTLINNNFMLLFSVSMFEWFLLLCLSLLCSTTCRWNGKPNVRPVGIQCFATDA